MKAGRELDALVAEKVMGIRADALTCWPETFDELIQCGEWEVFSDDDGRRWSCRHPACSNAITEDQALPLCNAVKHYSADISAAWEVHRKACGWIFSKRRRYLSLLQDVVSNNVFSNEKSLAAVQTGGEDGEKIAWPDVLVFLQPVHICLAAVGVEVE